MLWLHTSGYIGVHGAMWTDQTLKQTDQLINMAIEFLLNHSTCVPTYGWIANQLHIGTWP